MFTGLVEKVGRLERMVSAGDSRRVHVVHDAWDTPLADGESVAVNGVCLTVEIATAGAFTCSVLDETVRSSNLDQKTPGSPLNLERALCLGDRLGGHIMSGHVDGVARLQSVERHGVDRVVRVSGGRELLDGMVDKGSVGVGGISLTLSALDGEGFEVCLVPHTWDHTAMPSLSVGDPVNIELDMLGKYVRRHLAAEAAGGVTEDLLRRCGLL